MDLPAVLEKATFIEGIDEIKQCLVELLSEEKRSFVQSPTVGSTSVIHTQMSWIEVDTYLNDVFSQVSGVTLKGFDMHMEDTALVIDVRAEYNKQTILLQNKNDQWQ